MLFHTLLATITINYVPFHTLFDFIEKELLTSERVARGNEGALTQCELRQM